MNLPPEAIAMNTGRSRSVPTLPPGPVLNVRRARTTWSIHAFSAEGTPRLCMGVPMTTTSDASSSRISSSDRATEPSCVVCAVAECWVSA
ncbi:hypothetical protein D9M72_320170 [compost metagenome]